MEILGGNYMDDLLKQICKKHGVTQEVIDKVLRIEKIYVYKNKRFGINDNLRQIIEDELSERKENSFDNK